MGASRVVIVGAGLGGLRTAEALRAAGFDDELVVIGNEPHGPYSRPPLSKDFLSGRHDVPDIVLNPTSDLGDVNWRLDTAVAASRLDKRHVVLEDGSVIEFDALVVATGVRSRRLDLPGPITGRHALRSLNDATVLRKL